VNPRAGPTVPGRPRLHFRLIDSTNGRARALALAGAPDGTLVTAAEQSAGRGRQGRSWSAPSHSSLLMSLLVRWPAAARAPNLLPLVAAVAVCDAIEPAGAADGAGALIKWPNDIVTASPGGQLAKLAGILVEGRPQEHWAVLGIGLNVALRLEELPPELRERAATLGRGPQDVEPLLERVLEALSLRLQEPADELLAAWNARDALRGRRVSWGLATGAETNREGVARGVDGMGRLIVALDGGGQTTLEAGEVHLAQVVR
jgi:BirA family biotin operon repressor/biotin-[acetyl-CoA-carboxylase] ligase